MDCHYLILTSSHEIRCRGWADFLLGDKRTTKSIFDVTKSLSYIWNFKNRISGEWAVPIWLGIPKVKIAGVTLNFKLKYQIEYELNANLLSKSPYTIQLRNALDAEVSTDSYASARLFAIEAGAYIKGVLVGAGTDVTVTSIFDFKGRKVVIKFVWYLSLRAVKAEFGFFYRTLKLFGGWTKRKSLGKWNVNLLDKKWTLLNNSITIKVD